MIKSLFSPPRPSPRGSANPVLPDSISVAEEGTGTMDGAPFPERTLPYTPLKKQPVIAFALLGAILTLATPLARGQGSANELFNRAFRELQSNNSQAAADAFDKLLELAKDDKGAQSSLEGIYYGLGAARFNLKEYDKAVASFTELLKKYPQSRSADEVRFFLARALFNQKDYPKAIEGFKAVENIPAYRGDALLYQAVAFREMGKASDGIEPLVKLVGKAVNTSESARGALNLAALYAQVGNASKALETLTMLAGSLRFLPNVAAFNQACVLVGDTLQKEEKSQESLAAYRLMRSKADVLKLQDKQIAQLTKGLEVRNNSLKTAQSDRVPAIQGDIARFAELLAEVQGARKEAEKASDLGAGVLLRTAKAFYDTDRKWEAVTAYDELIKRYPETPERESALFGMLATYPEIGQHKLAQKLCEQFLAEFPKSDRLMEVAFMKGVIALQGEDPEQAVKIFAEVLKQYPDTKYKEEIAYLTANARFEMGFYDEALADYETYLKVFPTDNAERVQEVTYRKPLCLVYAGKYEQAIDGLNNYIKANADSPYTVDAKYRLMVCYFAAAVNDKTGKLYTQIIDLTKQFEEKYPGSNQLGEVLALRGDALAGLGALPGQDQGDMDDKAAEAYLKGYQNSKNDETLNYNLFEAVKLWQKHGQWEKVTKSMEEFIRDNPDHASAPTAKYWIGRSLVKQRKDAEAKEFYAKEIRQYMSQPRKDAVEMMIQQLVQMIGRKKRPAPPPPDAPTPPADGSAPNPTVAPVPPPAPAPDPAPQVKPEEELDQLIGGPEVEKNRASMARLFLARAMLADMKPETKKMHDVYFDQLGEFEPSELSAYLLGQIGDFFITKAKLAGQKGDADAEKANYDKAEKFCRELLASFPQSDFKELGYVGQGEIAFGRKNWQVAYQWFKDAIEVAAAQTKAKDALFGQARSLLELGKYDDAKKLFQQIASAREWRSLAGASIFHLGEIDFRQQKWDSAHAYFQRVYVGYAKSDWVPNAYIRDAECFQKMNKPDDAAKVVQELIRNIDKWQGRPELDQARKMLRALGR